MKIKTKKQLTKRLIQLEQIFDKQIHKKAIKAINQYLDNNPPFDDTDSVWNIGIEKYREALILGGAWANDRLNGKLGTLHHHTYPKSMTKKVRKILGFNI